LPGNKQSALEVQNFFFVPCIVIQLSNVNQQNALFKLMF